MNRIFRILVPLIIIGLTYLTVSWMMANRPVPVVRKPPPAVTAVEATRLQPVDYRVRIPSQGVVRPRTQSTLKPEVSGRVMFISPSFRDGGFFEKDDVLLTIDPADYETAVVVAEATLAQRRGALEVEKAQSEQAIENWKLLGDGTEPNPLTLRKPQMAEAMANVASAEARLVEAKRNLERTSVRAPYAGRILRKEVDVGQTVSPGNALADIFAVDYVEIRLPIDNQHLDYLDLPEDYRGEDPGEGRHGPKVILKGEFGSKEMSWEGTIVRAEGAFDPASRQLFVVAQVTDPYSKTGTDKPPLKVNQFVQAEIMGHVLKGVFVVPRKAVRDGDEVLIVDRQNKIRRRVIEVIWRDLDNVIVKGNLKPDEVLCTTSMMFAADGATVEPTIDGVAPAGKEPTGAGDSPGKMTDGAPLKPIVAGKAAPAAVEGKPQPSH